MENRQAVAWIGGVVLAAMIARILFGTYSYNYFVDDAFIFMRYARNFANGDGLVYNPGESIMGFTSPLFAILTALLSKLLNGVPLEILFRNLNFVLAAVGCGLAAKALRIVTGWQALLYAPIFLYYPMIDGSLNGMETSLYLLTLAGSLYAFGRGRSDQVFAWGVLAALARPEGALVALIGVAYLIRDRKSVQWRYPVGAIALAAVWILLSWRIYGSPLPQSMLAKSSMSAGQAWAGMASSAWDKVLMLSFGFSQVLQEAGPPVRWLLSAALLGLAPFFWIGWRKGGKDPHPAGLAGTLFLANVAFYIVGAPVRMWSWYVVPTTFLFLISALHGIEICIAEKRTPRVLIPSLAALIAIASIGAGAVYRSKIASSRIAPSVLGHITDYLLGTYPNARSIMLGDIGYVGYQTNWRVLDMAGLVTPGAIRREPDGGIRYFGSFVRDENPDLILIDQDPAQRPAIVQSYVAFRSFADSDQQDWFNRTYRMDPAGPEKTYHVLYVRRALEADRD